MGAEQQWTVGDVLGEAACTGALFIGTHFPTRPAGRVVADGGAWRFVPE